MVTEKRKTLNNANSKANDTAGQTGHFCVLLDRIAFYSAN